MSNDKVSKVMSSPQRFVRQTTEGSLDEYIEYKYEKHTV